MDKFCSNCGAEIKEGADVCLNCGKAIKKIANTDPNAKSKLVAGLLGIFLGTFGIHNFYLGYTSRATTQLLLTVLSCGILAIISEVWGLIEGIQILTGTISVDANGVPLKD